jgi:hypothetical protein
MIAKRIWKDDYLNNGKIISNEEQTCPTHTPHSSYITWAQTLPFIKSKKKDWEGRASSDQIGVAPAECWNWGEWGLKEYNWKWPFLGWFVGLVAGTRDVYPALAALLTGQPRFFYSPYIFSLNVFPSPNNLIQSFIPAFSRLSFSRINSGTETPAPGQAVVRGRLPVSECRLRAPLGAGDGGVVMWS